MDSPHLDYAGDQPEGSSVNPVPHPSIDVTRTKLWVSVRDEIQLDVATAVTHNNLEVLAGLVQATHRMLLDQAKLIKKLEAENRIIKAYLRSIIQALGEDTASETSLDEQRLGSRASSVGDSTGEEEDQNEDPADVALAKGKSKKAAAVNEGFATDVSGRGGDGSQLTNVNTPRKTRDSGLSCSQDPS